MGLAMADKGPAQLRNFLIHFIEGNPRSLNTFKNTNQEGTGNIACDSEMHVHSFPQFSWLVSATL
jgi:hypothetical protein